MGMPSYVVTFVTECVMGMPSYVPRECLMDLCDANTPEASGQGPLGWQRRIKTGWRATYLQWKRVVGEAEGVAGHLRSRASRRSIAECSILEA